jgi:hypothetical protein
MGLDHELQDERGESLEKAVGDPQRILDGLLQRAASERLPLLSGVDFYGDTIFNRQQMPRLIEEWAQVKRWAASKDQRDLIERLLALCRRCESDVHTYFKIIGD